MGSIPVAVQPAEAWERFADLDRWREWDWMGMADAAWVSGEPWQRGAIVRLGHRPFTFECEIHFCDPPFEVIWAGGGFGVDARHTYRFLPNARGCLVVSDETFTGPAARTILPLVRWYWRRHLLGFRAWVESGHPPGAALARSAQGDSPGDP